MANPWRAGEKRIADSSPGPWRAWKGLTRHGRAIKFIETYCAASKGTGHGKPLILGQSQKEWLERALASDTRAAIRSTPRGNGKSTLGGALAVWALFDDDETGQPQVPIIATTIGQAIKSCYGVAAAMIRNCEELDRRALSFTGISSTRTVVPFMDYGEMFPVSNNADGLQGLDPSLAIVDEIGFQPQESWDALHLAQGKRERSVVLGLGTPGLDTANALYHVRSVVKERGAIPRLDFTEHAAPEDCAISDRAAWRLANPAIGEGFLSEAALEADLEITPEPAFRVFRLGQWANGVTSWLGDFGAQRWEALTSPYALIEGEPVWVGVDMGLKHDSTAVATAQRRPDGRLHVHVRLWLPTAEEAVDTTDVMQHLRDIADRFDLRAVSFDPRFFEVPSRMLEDEGLPMVEVPQSVERMTGAIGRLYELVARGGLTHDGDPLVSHQVVSAQARFNDRGFTLSKPRSRTRIDAAIGIALAVDRAEQDEGESDLLIAWAG